MPRLRIFVIDPFDSTRDSLALLLESLGHEVIPCSEPSFCPGYNSDSGCSQDNACADVLVLSQYLPQGRGLEFIRKRHKHGCQVQLHNMFLICDPNEGSACEQAREIGGRPLQMPLDRARLAELLEAVAREISPSRRLVPLEQLQLPRPKSKT